MPSCLMVPLNLISQRQAKTSLERDPFEIARNGVQMMWRVLACAVLAGGCASPNHYESGPPTTVREPTFDGQFKPASRVARTQSISPAPAIQRASTPEVQSPTRNGFVEWFKSGRGWTWGAASRDPVRDVALDRLMADTLTGSEPSYSREPTVNSAPISSESWIYPTAGQPNGRTGSNASSARGGSIDRTSMSTSRADSYSRQRTVPTPDSSNVPTGPACPIDDRPARRDAWQPASF